jgi:hypothetical protein
MTHVKYIERTREYYLSQGYDQSYAWAHFDDVPFTPLKKPLAESRITLISTGEIAIRFDPDTEDDPMEETQIGNIYSIPSAIDPDRLYSHSYSYDRFATTLDDLNSFFPVTRLHEAVESGRLGSMAARLHSGHYTYSQRKTLERDAPEVLKRCREDGVDIAVLVPI